MTDELLAQIQRQHDAWGDAQPFYPDKSTTLLLLTGKNQDQRTDDLIAICGLCGKSLALESDIRDITIRGERMRAHGKCASDRLTDRFVRASRLIVVDDLDYDIDITPERLQIEGD